jgi:hypothetical protein
MWLEFHHPSASFHPISFLPSGSVITVAIFVSYPVKDAGDVFPAVQDVNFKTQPPEKPMAHRLKRARLLTGRFDFHKSHPPLWEKYQPVWHPVKSGADQFGTDAAAAFCGARQFLFDAFFLSHVRSSISWPLFQAVQVVLFSP